MIGPVLRRRLPFVFLTLLIAVSLSLLAGSLLGYQTTQDARQIRTNGNILAAPSGDTEVKGELTRHWWSVTAVASWMGGIKSLGVDIGDGTDSGYGSDLGSGHSTDDFSRPGFDNNTDSENGTDFESGMVGLDMDAIASILRGEPTHGVSDVWHNMTDVELFEKAKNVAREERAGKRKLAFLFLTRGRLPLAPLWWRFLKGYRKWYSIYIHTMPGFQYTKNLPRPFRRRQIPSQEVGWGKMSMVDAERRLLANALLDPLNDRFILVSESCIPIFNFTFIYNYLINTNISFIASRDAPGPWGRGRYNKGFLPEVTIKQWRKGSQWFEFTRESAFFVISETFYYNKFNQFCTKTCYNDEHYLPTIFYIKHPDKIGYRTVMHVDWSRRGWHPKSYTKRLVKKKLIQEMRDVRTCTWNNISGSHCFLFARKFRPGAIATLLELAPWMGM